jgi:hypothetical protein
LLPEAFRETDDFSSVSFLDLAETTPAPGASLNPTSRMHDDLMDRMGYPKEENGKIARTRQVT